MTALLTISPPIEPEATRLELPVGCPFPAVCECPEHPSGVVLVFHTGRRGASVPSVENVAAELRLAGMGTVLVDLTAGSRGGPIDPSPMPLLVERARRVVAWLGDQPSLAGLPLGLMGVNGAAAVALAVAGDSSRTEAVVIWGGEPDQADEALAKVAAPVLLLAGSSNPAANAARWSAIWFVRHLAMERRWRQARVVGV